MISLFLCLYLTSISSFASSYNVNLSRYMSQNAMLSYNGDNKDMQKVDGVQNFLHNVCAH